MRNGITLAALGGALVTVAPAEAATIVQYDSEQGANAGFVGFDSRLGRLDKATLEITVSKYRAWQVDVPRGGATTIDVGWSVDGLWVLSGFYLDGRDSITVPLAGSGVRTVALDRTFSSDTLGDRAYGYFEVNGTGAATVELASSLVTDRRVFFNGLDLGYNDPTGADTTFAVSGPHRLLRLSGGCFTSGYFVSTPPEDLCGSANYKLTYDYTPAVPEPATWAMMLLGFGAVGAAMRHGGRRIGVIFG